MVHWYILHSTYIQRITREITYCRIMTILRLSSFQFIIVVFVKIIIIDGFTNMLSQTTIVNRTQNLDYYIFRYIILITICLDFPTLYIWQRCMEV